MESNPPLLSSMGGTKGAFIMVALSCWGCMLLQVVAGFL